MNRDITRYLAPIAALLSIALVLALTLQALRATGAFGQAPRARAPLAALDPYRLLDDALSHDSHAGRPLPRDPFSPRSVVAVRSETPRTIPSRPAAAAAPAIPVVTAIVSDSDPRALVRWKGREWTIRPGGLFDEFVVRSITRDQVTLLRGSETLVLTRKDTP